MFVLERAEQTWLDRPDWQDTAKCAGYPSNWFFLDDLVEDELARRRKGRVQHRLESELPGLEVCRSCSVLKECLEDALSDRSLDHGIRGGRTSSERKLLRKLRNRWD